MEERLREWQSRYNINNEAFSSLVSILDARTFSMRYAQSNDPNMEHIWEDMVPSCESIYNLPTTVECSQNNDRLVHNYALYR